MTSSNQNHSLKPSLITALATILAAFIGGSFLVYVTTLRLDAETSGSSISQKLSEQCSEPIEDTNDARDIKKACSKIIEKGEKSDILADHYINRARATIVLWDSDKLEKDIKFEEVVGRDFEQALSMNSDNPKALFYSAYWKDFQERVLKQNPDKLCRSAENIYGEAINKYLNKYQSTYKRYVENGRERSVANHKNLPQEEAYALIELGHWVNNRDRNWDLAIKLYDVVLAHYQDTSDSIKYNALVSRGVAWYDDGLYQLAIEDFEKAIEVKDKIAKSLEEEGDFNQARKIKKSSELYNNLGSAYAKVGRYSEAVKGYTKAIENQSDNTKKYYSLRDKAYALILQGSLKYQPLSLNSQAQENFQEAIKNLKTAEVIDGRPSDNGLLYVAFGIAYNFNGNENMAQNKFSLAQKINPMNRATKEYTKVLSNQKQKIDNNDILPRENFFTNPIPHDIGHDPVLEVKHKYFYCKSADNEIE